MTPLRILHCMRAPLGGLFRHVLDLAEEQAGLGHAVGIVADSTTADATAVRRLREIEPRLGLGVGLIAMSRKPGIGDLGSARAVLGRASLLKPDVLHGHGAKGGAYARLAALAMRRLGRNVTAIYTPHGGSLHFPPQSLEGRSVTALERVLRRLTDGLIFESDFARRVYADRIGLGSTRVCVVPNGLKAQDFEVRRANGGAADFLFIGELRQLKGVDVMLAALARLNKTRRVSAVIVGSGPDAAEFQALASRLGLDAVVRFAGPMPAQQAFALGRILVVPSRAESFPYIVLEAGAAGVPLIATNVGGIPEMTAETSVELIPPGDVAALTRAMDQALTAPERADERAVQLRTSVAHNFTAARMAASVTNFYTAARPL